MTIYGGRSTKLTVLGMLGIAIGGIGALGGFCGVLPMLLSAAGFFTKEMAASAGAEAGYEAAKLSPIMGVALGANMAIGVMLVVSSVGILRLRRWARGLATGVAGLMILRFGIGAAGLRAAKELLQEIPLVVVILIPFVADFVYPLSLILILNSASTRQEFLHGDDSPFGI